MGFHGKQILPGTLPVDRINTAGYMPMAASDLATVEYTQALFAGLDPKEEARARATGDVNIVAPPTDFDGVTANEFDRIVLGDQTDPTENGVWDYHAAGMTRSPDFDGAPSAEVKIGSFLFIKEGATWGGFGIFVSGTPATPPIIDVGVDPIVFSILREQTDVTADNGLTKIGSNIRLGGPLVANTNIDGAGTYDLSLTNLASFEVSTGAHRMVIDKGGSVYRLENFAATEVILDITDNWRINFAIDDGGGAGQVNADYSINMAAAGNISSSAPYSFAAGRNHVIGNGTGVTGDSGTAFGIDTINYGEASITSGVGAQIIVAAGQRGGIAHGFSIGSGLKPVGVPYVTAASGAVNISRNTAAQTVGFGALSQDSVILGGFDHNIPNDSPRSVILGGSGIVARGTDPDQVYVPNLNITVTPDNDDLLTQVLVRDDTTNEIKYRNASTFGGTTTASNGLTKVVNDIQLGGTLISSVSIIGTFDFELGGAVTDRLDSFQVNTSATGSGILMQDNGGGVTINSQGGFNIRETAGNGINIEDRGDGGIRLRSRDGGLVTLTEFFMDNSEATFTDSRVTQVGIQYAADYSATYTSRSLVDKDYVDNAISVNAGWAKTGLTTLIGATDIKTAGNNLNIISETTGILRWGYFKPTGNATDAYIQIQTGFGTEFKLVAGNDRVGGNEYGSVIMSSSGPAMQYRNVAGNHRTLTIGSADMVFTDTISSRGASYAADYSANFTIRSLVDKGYVDNAISVGGVTASNGLTKVVNDIQLGGALTADVSITGAFALNLDQDVLRFGGISTTSDDLITDFTVISPIDGEVLKRRIPWIPGNNRSTAIQPIKGPGTVDVTNGSNAVVGTGTLFTDATFLGMSFWQSLWVYDGANWWRGVTVIVSDDTNLTSSLWYSFADVLGGYAANSGTTFPGVTGTYEYYIVNNFSDFYGAVFGNNSVANNYGFAFGGGVVASGLNAMAMGNTVVSSGNRAMAMGFGVLSDGTGAFGGGQGTLSGGIDRRIRSSGNRSFNWSENTTAQTAGNGALANNSAILGGINHHIPSTSPRSAIVGGDAISARATDPDQVYVPNFNIVVAPPVGAGIDDVMVRDMTTGQLKAVTQASIAALAVIPPPSSVDRSKTPVDATTDGATTGLTITNTPKGLLIIAVNGIIHELGDGIKTKAFYFSADGGTTARAYAAIVAGDTLYFNAVIADYSLDTLHIIDMIYI